MQQLPLNLQPGITIRQGADLYFTVLYNGVPNGAFWYQPAGKHWQGITRSNRLLSPTPSIDDCLAGVIDKMESI